MWTYLCQRLVKNWVQRRLQLLLHVLKQDGIPKLDGVLKHLQVLWHLKVYDLQTLEQRTESVTCVQKRSNDTLINVCSSSYLVNAKS